MYKPLSALRVPDPLPGAVSNASERARLGLPATSGRVISGIGDGTRRARLLTAHDARTMVDQVRVVQKEVIDQLVVESEKLLESAAKRGEKSIVYTVPTFVLGYPMYDQAQIAKKLQKILVFQGFLVKRLSDTDLWINWSAENPLEPSEKERRKLDAEERRARKEVKTRDRQLGAGAGAGAGRGSSAFASSSSRKSTAFKIVHG